MRHALRRGLRFLWIVAGLSFTAWMFAGFQAVGVPGDTLESDRDVAVEASDRGVAFRRRAHPLPAGLIFLPGGMVQPLAYAPLMRRIAEAGYSARLLYLPMRCGCTDAQLRELFRDIRRTIDSEPGVAWVLAGHSRGGMLASRFAYEDGAGLAGLAPIATTHPRDFSLAALTIPVTKIYGSADGVAAYAKMHENRHLLPPGTAWVEIPGGNHVQFGYYRHQLFGGPATISRAEQQALLLAALLDALAAASRP